MRDATQRGGGAAAQKCPFDAITIINLPSNLASETTHRHSANSFKLHRYVCACARPDRVPRHLADAPRAVASRLPIPRPGQVLGLVGTNGIGKSTALKILAGKLKPNLGHYESPPDWEAILAYFRGSELQNYFTRILEDRLKAGIKPQYVDHLSKVVRGVVGPIIAERDERNAKAEVVEDLGALRGRGEPAGRARAGAAEAGAVAADLAVVQDRNVADLSGGELQRFAIAVLCVQKKDIYMFDEPSSYLDVKQRLRAARMIRKMVEERTYVIVVEVSVALACAAGTPAVQLPGSRPLADPAARAGCGRCAESPDAERYARARSTTSVSLTI